MKKVLITYHSQGGNTEAMAKAVFKSANAAGAEVILQRTVDADAQHRLACDIVAIGTPDHFGYMAGLVKDRFDLVRATIQDKVGDNPYVTFGSKGAGPAQALDGVDRNCNSLKMVKAFEGILITRKPTEEYLAECRDLGEKLAWLERTLKPQRIEEPLL